MIIKTKRVDSKHVLVLEAPDVDYDEKITANECDVYLAKRLDSGGLERIPDDEPIITFRSRDRLAQPLLLKYRQMCVEDGCNTHQLDVLDSMIVAFTQFRVAHPDRMKQPGITRGR